MYLQRSLYYVHRLKHEDAHTPLIYNGIDTQIAALLSYIYVFIYVQSL